MESLLPPAAWEAFSVSFPSLPFVRQWEPTEWIRVDNRWLVATVACYHRFASRVMMTMVFVLEQSSFVWWKPLDSIWKDLEQELAYEVAPFSFAGCRILKAETADMLVAVHPYVAVEQLVVAVAGAAVWNN